MTKELKVEAATTSFPVVGIGTSAGGLSALEDFFDNMPNNAGAAFVVIQHLAPDFKSLMRELLKKYTDMRVEQVEDGVELEPNCIFLIPPGQNLELQDNALRLTAQNRDSGHSIHFPINTFFRSLSVARKDKAIGIILSGTGSDGSKGIHAISEQGGIVMVQSPETAEFDGMPLSAIATSIPDFVLHARELALTTSQIIASPSQRAYLQASILNGSQLDRIISLLNNYENIDFTHYKTGTLERQITRRCALSGNLSIEQYTQQLEQSAEEREILRDALLITVTHFLRDIEAWQYLKSEVLPKIVEQGKETGTIRIWVTACATGEEAYSIAILLSELLPAEQNSPIEIKIFATDIDPIALRKASQGTYSADTMKNLTAEQIQRFFTQKESGFEVSRSLREMVIFANHNLIKDAVFTKIDLVSCRNILIYLQPALQQQVLHNLHFSLKQQGILFLGESENIGALEGEFIPVHRKWNIYQKSRNSRLPALSYLSAYRGTQQLMQKTISAPPQTPKFDPLIETAFTALLQDRFATCILVDRDNQVLHVCGDALELLRVATGRVSQDLFKMLPNSLHLPLSTALHRARLQDNKVHYRDCQITEEGYEVNRVSVEVSKQKSQSVDSFLMVLIEATSLPKMLETAENFESDQETAQYILQLQHELQANRENLQATVEELEVINEEQQATNEELTASNEELQSTNEELHSVNEELYT
ncbi:MAG: chemotaxis protein CheB, partial [Cyanobacteria bacterium J06621_11]